MARALRQGKFANIYKDVERLKQRAASVLVRINNVRSIGQPEVASGQWHVARGTCNALLAAGKRLQPTFKRVVLRADEPKPRTVTQP